MMSKLSSWSLVLSSLLLCWYKLFLLSSELLLLMKSLLTSLYNRVVDLGDGHGRDGEVKDI